MDGDPAATLWVVLPGPRHGWTGQSRPGFQAGRDRSEESIADVTCLKGVDMMATWEVRLLGELSIVRDGRNVDPPAGAKVQQLLAYLLVSRDRAHSRERLAALLWGDVSTAQSKKYLRQALWQLRAATTARRDDALLAVGPDWVRVNPGAAVKIDVGSFEQAFASTRGIAGGDLDAVQIAALQSAVDLYRGEFLEGCYSDWCLRERERLQSIYMAVLEKLMGWCEAQRRYEEGVAHGQRVLLCDPAREVTHQRLMRLLLASGDRAGALRQYERCVAALAEELEVEPSDETRALYGSIRTRCVVAGWGDEPPAERSLAGILACLADLRGALSELDRKLEAEIAIVRAAVAGRVRMPAAQIETAPQPALRAVERVGRRVVNGAPRG